MAPALFCFILLFGGCAHFQSQPKIFFGDETLRYEDTAVFTEVLFLIKENFYRDINAKQCVQKILQGGVPRCTDQYSYYLTKEETKIHEENLAGHFFGIGASLAQKQKGGVSYIAVMSVVEGGPADRGGVKPGDLVVAVSSDAKKDNLVSTHNLSVYDAVKLIRGAENTHVLLLIKRDDEVLEFDLAREDIKIKILSGKLLKPEVGYIKLNEFSGDELKEDFIVLASSLQAQGAEALVFDLRNNPGGFLRLSIYISSLFQTDKSSADVLYAEGKNFEIIYNNEGIQNKGRFGGLKVAVLTNGGSASASEIVTAYLKNYCGAKVVGEKTFGKGVVQAVMELKNGGRLMLTVSEYFVGEKRIQVHGIGVAPDYEVENPDKAEKEEDDLQLKKAIEVVEEMLKE